MADVNANIDVNLNTQEALANLRNLQAGLSRFNQSLTQGNVAAMDAQKGLNQQLIQSINATGKFVASQRSVSSSTGAFTEALEKNKLSMREYFRFTAAAATANTKSLKGVFAQERDIINRARRDRVKALQTQYVQLTNANGDLVKVLQVVPKHLQMVNGRYTDYATRVQMAAQRQQFLNQLLKQGSTQLLNFGKNTQWAGRQLMVGLTVPLTMLGSYASKAFMEMEKAVIKFTRVYGDMTTSMGDTDEAVKQIQMLAKEFTKYGIAVVDTVTMAADAAAMGLTGSALTAQVTAATKLAVLGQVEQQQALETTISLQNAFGISSEELAHKINFLNAVENQTVLSIEDLTTAIPKAGPVVKQLGGSVEDLAFFMTAMKEGGINASEGANALKSGLASMINPAKKTSEFLAGLGINIKGIVDNNAGNLKATVVGLAQALDTLDPLNRARAIEQLFGKFQFSRLSTLFQNVTKDSSQASRALGLAGASVEELAILSERELGKVEDSVGIKFKKSLEDLKLQLIPIGKAFLQAITPIVKFTGKILEKFNNLGDGTKRVITTIVGVLGLVAPAALMMVGLVANGFANLIKLFAMMRNGVAKLNGQNNILGGGFDYLTQAETENLAQSNALHLTHKDLIDTFNVESGAVNALALAYTNAASQARTLASSAPGLFNTVPGPAGAVSGLPKPKKYAEGIVSVPGPKGAGDVVPAMLSPGEAVIPTDIVKKYGPFLAAMMTDDIPGYEKSNITVKHFGRTSGGTQSTRNVGEAGMQGPGNQTDAGTDFPWLATIEASGEDASESTLSFAASMKLLLMRSSGVTRNTEASYNKFTKSWDGVTDIVDELGVVYRGGLLDDAGNLRTDLTTVADYANERYPLVIQHIDQMERDLRITAEQATMLRTAARKLIKPDVGTPENPGPDASERNRARYETGLDEDGNEVVTGKKVERVDVPGGPKTLKKTTAKAVAWEAKERGQDVPLGVRLGPTEYKEATGEDPWQFTHQNEGEVGTVWDDPKGSNGTAGEKRIIEKLIQAREDATVKVREGEIVASGVLSEAADAAGRITDEVIETARTVADAASPSKRTEQLGKDIADGLTVGMQSKVEEVKAQSAQLAEAAVPKKPRTAAETQARIDKMDLDNKAFYDDINTPEFHEQRQILKSQDRHRRKMGATGTVGGGPVTPPVSGPSPLIVSSTAKTEAAAEQLAVSTEQAATAQSQVVQQIHDESKSRVTIKGNTINIGKARQEADRLDKEAADAEAAAAKIRTEAAKWEEVAAREKGKNMQTAENAKALKKQADEAEIRAAEARIKAAEAARIAAEEESGTGSSEQTIQDPVKTPAKVKKAEKIVANGTQEQGDGLRRIVEGTNDTADSTTLVADKTDEVADKTDELVDATSETVDAQTTHADNVVTSSELANATSNNLENVVNATQQTGISQEDIANSSEDISETNDKISKEKREALRLEEEANRKKRAELGQPPLDGPIPPGSQAGNKIPSTYVDIDEARAEAYGTDTTKGFTQNKKGQIILDPETGQPTTLDEKQILKKKRGMRREKASKFSGKAAGALGMATMVAGAVGAPPAVTGALGTAAGVAQMAPMLAGMGPVGWVVAGITAVGVGLYALNKRLQASYAAQAKFVRETSASTQKMKEIGMITGKVGASELQARKRAGGTTRDYITRERAGSSFGDTFMQSDTGKNMAKTLQANITKSGAKQAAETFATEIAAYVQDGVLTAAQAQDIAYQIGVNFKDTSLGIKIDANLAALIGPNGEDLTKDPIIIGTRLIQSAEQGSLNAVKSIDEAKSHGLSGATEAAELGARDAVAIQMAQMQADAVAKRYDDEIRTLETQLAQTKNKEAQVKLEDKLRALKEKANDAEFQMNNLVANQVDNSMERFTKEIQHQSVVWDAVTFGLYKLWGAGNQREAAYTQSLNAAVTDKYANTEQATQAATVSDRLAKFADGKTLGFGTNNYEDAGFVGGKEAQQFEVKMKLLMANGTLTPNQTTAMLDLFEGNLPQLETVLDIGTRMHGASGTAELLMMLTNFQDKTYAQDIAFEITTKDNDTFKKLSDIIGLASWLDGKEIDMEVVIKNAGGVAGLEYYIAKLDELETKIKELKGKPITQDDVAKFTKDTKVKVTDKYLDYVNKEFKGDAKKQTNAIRTYTLIYDQIMSMDYTSPEARKYFETQAGQIALEKLQALDKAGTAPDDFKTYLKQQTELEIDALITKVRVDPSAVATDKAIIAQGIKPIVDPNAGGPVKTPGGGKADNPLDFLDALAMRIKMIRDQAFKATKPIESMLAAFRSKAAQKDVSNMFTLFDGLQQRLIALKAPKEFRDHIAGLDAKGLEALKNKDADPTKKGNQSMFTYETKKVKGKTVVDKSRIAGFSEAGKAFMAAYNEAPLAEFNVEQAETIQNTNNQYKAFAMLKAQQVDTAKALDAVSNAAVAAALTSGLLAKTDLDKYIADIKTSNDALQKQAVINDLLAKNSAMEFAEKSMPQLASAMKASGYSAEQIAKVLEDPNLAKQLIEDLNDGKVDSKAISDYLNNIKKEKFVEIKGKFNAGDFAAAAAPGMELVNKMFAVQEQLIRTGVDERSAAMVSRLKSNKDANEKAQLEIQNITFKQIVPIQKTIEAAQRKMEVEIIRVIEAYQEEINDMQRVIELAFERPIQKINEQNAQLTHDLDVMNHAAEQINKSYDDQATALSKVAEVNAQIVNQQKQQLGLADALSQGDIAAAARAAQEMRASQADRNAENASKALEQSRQNELNNLRGEKSGLTREQITEKQYQNAQKIYELENTATTKVGNEMLTRLQLLDRIQAKTDAIYDLEEKREAAQLAIRAKEDEIYNINKKQIEPIQDGIDARNNQIANDEYAMQQLVNNIQVQGQTRDHWDRVTAKIEASSVAGQDFDHLMGSMLASVEKIDQGWEKINETIGLNAKGVTEGAKAVKDAMLKESAGYEQAQAVKIANAKIAEAAAQKEYETKMAAYDAEVARIKKLQSMGLPSQVANQMIAKVVKPKAPVVGPTEAADNPNVSYNNPSVNTADQYRKDNLKNVKPSKSDGTGTGTGSGGGGGTSGNQTTNKNTTPTPTPTAPTPTAPTPTAPTPTPNQVVVGGVVKRFAPQRAQGTTATQRQAYLALANTGTYEGLSAAKRIAKDVKDRAFDNLKNYKGKDASGNVITDIESNTETDYQRLTMESRAGWDKLNAEYQKANNRYKDFDRDSSGKSVSLQSSKEALTIQKRSKSLLPQWVRDSIKIIEQSKTMFDEDYSKFLKAEEAYNKVKKDKGFDKLTWEEIAKDPGKLKIVKPSHDAYDIALKQMKANNDYVDQTRWALRDDGYTSMNLGWAFDTPHTGFPLHEYSASGDITSEYLRKGMMTYYATGGFVASKFGQNKFSMGTDTVPAMLTPGEFVMSRYAVNSHGVENMRAINNGTAIGESVYNYNLSVNVKSDANPDDIARVVMAQIKGIDSQRVRGNRL